MIEAHVPKWAASGDSIAQALPHLVKPSDPVNHPKHYQRGGIETIDYIRATLGKDGYEGYCIGNALKYLSRYRDKDGVQDLEKARVYLTWAIESLGGRT